MKIRPVGSKLFHMDGRTDGQTDLTKPIVTFTILRTHLKMVKTVALGMIFVSVVPCQQTDTRKLIVAF
jgi:hypothetical protein